MLDETPFCGEVFATRTANVVRSGVIFMLDEGALRGEQALTAITMRHVGDRVAQRSGGTMRKGAAWRSGLK